jgi:hypothetical protein
VTITDDLAVVREALHSARYGEFEASTDFDASEKIVAGWYAALDRIEREYAKAEAHALALDEKNTNVENALAEAERVLREIAEAKLAPNHVPDGDRLAATARAYLASREQEDQP